MSELELRLEKAIRDGRPDAEIEDLRFRLRQQQENQDSPYRVADADLDAALRRWVADGPKRSVAVTDDAVTLSEGTTGRQVVVRLSLVEFALRHALERWGSQYGEG